MKSVQYLPKVKYSRARAVFLFYFRFSIHSSFRAIQLSAFYTNSIRTFCNVPGPLRFFPTSSIWLAVTLRDWTLPHFFFSLSLGRLCTASFTQNPHDEVCHQSVACSWQYCLRVLLIGYYFHGGGSALTTWHFSIRRLFSDLGTLKRGSFCIASWWLGTSET